MRPVWLVILLAMTLLAMPTRAHARLQLRPRPITWGPLDWSMSEDEALKALASMTPHAGETHGYFAAPPGEPVVHTVEPVVGFAPRKGWTGEAHFAWNEAARDYRIDRIVVVAHALSAAALRDEIAALASHYGTPLRRQANQMLWVRGGTWLVVSWTKTDLTVGLRLDATPPPVD